MQPQRAKIANLNAGRLTITAQKYVFPPPLSLLKKDHHLHTRL